MKTPEGMTALPLGSTLIALSDGAGRYEHLAVVLAKTQDDYVCWIYNEQSGGYSSGIYGEGMGPAVESFMARTRRYGGLL